MVEPLKRAVKFTANTEFTSLIVPKGSKKTIGQAGQAGFCTGILRSIRIIILILICFARDLFILIL
jgi:hypothetical protein